MAGALALSSCSAPAEDDSGSTDGSGGEERTTATVAWNQAFYSMNNSTSFGNATANANINYLTGSGFTYYDSETELQQNTDFGTYELLSAEGEPQSVRYTVDEGVTWSDGTPVDAADLLLYWVANSGALNTPDVAPEANEDGSPIAPEDAVFFDGSIGGGLEKVSQVPEVGDDGRSITLTYDESFVDWEQGVFWDQTDPGMPAHIVVEKALGIADPQEAKDAFIAAVQNNDAAALAPVSAFWNNGFNFTGMPDDPDLLVSSGAYTITDLQADEFVTLTRNEDYAWGPEPSIDEIVVRFIGDALAQATALENGEIDLMSPQATADLVTQLEGIEGITVENTVDATYEHVDLKFQGSRNPGVFADVRVRQAFLKALPRQQIVETLVRPINPEAEVRDSFILNTEFQGYSDITAGNGSEAYAETDVEGARALLAEAGVTNPEVCILFASNNPRRVNEFGLIQASANSAGFNVTDCSREDWSAQLNTDGQYDASLFGWQSTSTAVGESEANFATGGINNLNDYSNPAVDALYDQLGSTSDPAQQLEIQTQVDSTLYADAYGLTIYQFPGVTAWSDSLSGVATAPLSPTIFWNFWEWEKA